ncbi:MAG: hypothetical protein C0592_08080 [Marinilabiliales bacterium]|nr:MAG: hypothetical protein C0592_08080 [Marinilabiliales bacterium]
MKQNLLLELKQSDIVFIRSILLHFWQLLYRFSANLYKIEWFHIHQYPQFKLKTFDRNKHRYINHLDFGVLLE